jgi:hypothetical protein
MVYVEFDFQLSADGATNGPDAWLQMTQDFGIRRLHGAGWPKVGVLLDYRSAASGLVMAQPKYLANCGDAKDGDPAIASCAADGHEGYRVGPVPGTTGQCANDWRGG